MKLKDLDWDLREVIACAHFHVGKPTKTSFKHLKKAIAKFEIKRGEELTKNLINAIFRKSPN